jgi:DNA-directed RNA polymerase II subunit RPB1
MGIVQDALLGIMLFTRRDNFIDLDTVMNLMMWIGEIESHHSLPPPTILKPKPLWTGK